LFILPKWTSLSILKKFMIILVGLRATPRVRVKLIAKFLVLAIVQNRKIIKKRGLYNSLAILALLYLKTSHVNIPVIQIPTDPNFVATIGSCDCFSLARIGLRGLRLSRENRTLRPLGFDFRPTF